LDRSYSRAAAAEGQLWQLRKRIQLDLIYSNFFPAKNEFCKIQESLNHE
jgi:hypothetical protein